MTYTGTITVRDPLLVEEIEEGLPEGITAYIRYDDGTYGDSPRDWCNVATIINRNDRLNEIDADKAGLQEARDRWDWTDQPSFFDYATYSDTHINRVLHAVGREALIERYIRIFRPDIAYYRDYWAAGRENYGWGYIMAEDWTEGLSTSGRRLNESEVAACRITFDQEVETYRQWAEGEVYEVIVTNTETDSDAALCGVYDDYSWTYIKGDVIPDLIAEVTA